MSSSFLHFTLFCWGLVLLSACSSITEAPPSADSFQLIIFKQGWYDLGLRYKAEESLPLINQLDPKDSLFIVTLNDVELYDWNQQTMTLTAEATEKLAMVLDDHVERSEAVSALMSMKGSLGWGNALERALYTKAFMVRVEGETLYSGIFLDAISQMAIDYPVVRLSVTDEKATLSLLPVHVPFVMMDPIDGSGNTRAAPLTQEVQQDAQAAGDFFSTLISNSSTSDTAVQFRLLIRDERVKSLFEAVNKLR